jgi:hypothetical protein
MIPRLRPASQATHDFARNDSGSVVLFLITEAKWKIMDL